METIYAIGPKEELLPITEGSDFNNQGAIRESLDGMLVLLEESEDKFVDNPNAAVYTHEEVLQYLQDNKQDWELDEELE